jgi:hypothetical protein
MCEHHRSDDVLMLGQPPTMAELDTRKFRHTYIFDRLITTFLDDEDDDSNNLAFFTRSLLGTNGDRQLLPKDV